MAISPDTMRIGKKYRLINYDHETHFEVLEVLQDNDFIVKDLQLLEELHFKDLTRYGKGGDYELEEM
jgi:hypothetical protein